MCARGVKAERVCRLALPGVRSWFTFTGPCVCGGTRVRALAMRGRARSAVDATLTLTHGSEGVVQDVRGVGLWTLDDIGSLFSRQQIGSVLNRRARLAPKGFSGNNKQLRTAHGWTNGGCTVAHADGLLPCTVTHSHRERGKSGTGGIWNGETWGGENLAPVPKYRCQMWYKMPRLWHNQKHRPRTVVAISYGPLGGSGCFLEASRRLLGWWLFLPGGFLMLCCWAQGERACQER